MSLVDTLSRLNVPDLKVLVGWLPQEPPSQRKADLIATIVGGLTPSGLRQLWASLDALQRLAVGEALYSVQGVFDPVQFKARHGDLPQFATGSDKGYGGKPTRLALFLFAQDGGRCVPAELHDALKAFVPEPAAPSIASVAELPAALHDTPLTVRHTEHDALVDLVVMLRLTEQAKLQIRGR